MHVENKTYYHTIHEIGIALIQDIHVNVGDLKGHGKMETKAISVQMVQPNLPHEKFEEIAVALQVPNDLPPTQETRLISIRYRVAIVGDEAHIKSDTSIPIIICDNWENFVLGLNVSSLVLQNV